MLFAICLHSTSVCGDKNGLSFLALWQDALTLLVICCNISICHILYRFDSFGQRSLKLDSFIQCCVMLRGLTDAFRMRDTNQNGSITINYEDFMCLVLLNKP